MTDLNFELGQRLQEGSSHRNLKPIKSYGTRFVELEREGQVEKYLNFASNDYLGLSEQVMPVDFHSQPSSRLLSGNLLSLEQIESDIAKWMNKGSATIFSSGYTANLGMLSCLTKKGDLILADHAIHASLIDGMRLSSAKWKRFKHLDLEDLEKQLSETENQFENIWVVVEGLFSMDGDHFPLEQLLLLKSKYSFYIILDEAHSFGIYGEKGRGLAEATQQLDEIDVMMFNFSKALAMQGGVVVGPPNLKRYLINNCRSLIYTTATPWSSLQGLPNRLDQLKRADSSRASLKELCLYAQKLFEINIDRWSPILPIHLGDHELTHKVSQHLFSKGIYCPAILPPTVPQQKARLRVSLTACHKKEDIDFLFREISIALEGNS